jgi:hypothetical protein
MFVFSSRWTIWCIIIEWGADPDHRCSLFWGTNPIIYISNLQIQDYLQAIAADSLIQTIHPVSNWSQIQDSSFTDF